MPSYVSPNAADTKEADSNLLTGNSSGSEKSLINNENINPANAAAPNKMDINQLLSQIMSITSQSLKDAQERLVVKFTIYSKLNQLL